MRPTLTLFSFSKGETAFGFDKLRAQDSKDVDMVRESEILSDLNPICHDTYLNPIFTPYSVQS